MNSKKKYYYVNKYMVLLRKAYIIKPDHPTDSTRMRKALYIMLSQNKADDLLIDHTRTDISAILSGEESLSHFFERHPDEDQKRLFKTFIDEQIDILKDMLILRSQKDVSLMKKFLKKCKSEIDAQHYIFPLKRGDITFDEFCERHKLREKS